jgi:hypothetical protein
LINPIFLATMVQTEKQYSVELIQNRLFQGGRLLAIWQVFRSGQLTGAFRFSGQQWMTSIRLEQGKVTDLQFHGQGCRLSGMEGFAALKKMLSGDETTRFSVRVAE